VSLATDELRSVVLLVLGEELLEEDDGEVEAVVLLELGCCCEVVSDEYVPAAEVESVELVEPVDAVEP
jgi:hypothetical protein